MKTVYVPTYDLNTLQRRIMVVVEIWIREKKTVVPQKHIIKELKAEGYKDFSVVNALTTLLNRGYLRRSQYSGGNKGTSYVHLRGV